MARSNRSRRFTLTRRIAILIVAVFCGFCVLSSVQEKYGYNFGLPAFELPSPMSLINAILNTAGEDAPADDKTRDTLEVHQIDVGQGESILIIGPEKTVLIDSGEADQGEMVARYLQKQGVTFIDILIGTHPHSDHIGGMTAVVRSLDVGEVILPDIPDDIFPDTRTFTDLLTAIGDKGLYVTPALTGDVYSLGDGATLTILGPAGEYKELNDQSVVVRVEYGKTSFLFTGDASKAAEKDLLENNGLRSNVLGVGHHGSNTSTTNAFLEAVSPSIALVSCGRDNSYGHPHREVIESLREKGIRVLRTDQSGTIVLVSDGSSIGVETEKNS